MRATYAVMSNERVIDIRHEDLDPDQLTPDEILVEAEASIVSAGTELANFTALSPGVWIPGSWNAYPWRPGYGLVGKVFAHGEGAERFAEGQRVFCFGKHASLQRYNVAGAKPFESAFAIDEDLPAATVLMARMSLISISAPQLSEFQAGSRVVVFGLGLVGNLAAQLYRLSGARVIALDPVSQRCQLAKEVGIEEALDVPIGEQLQTIRHLIPDESIDIAVDAVGSTAILERCVELCGNHGQVLLLGSPRKPFETNATKMMRAIHHRWIVLRGALEWRLPAYAHREGEPSVETNLHLLIDHIQAGRLITEPLVTHVIPPSQLEEAYLGLLEKKDEYLGVVVDWTGEI